MTLNRDRFLVRWFFWSLGIVDAFIDGDLTWSVERKGTNLCFFCQTILLYAPLVLLANALAYGGLLTVAVFAPVHFFGVSRYVIAVGTMALLIGAVVAWAWFWNDDERRRARRARKHKQEKGGGEPSAAALLVQWFVSQKRKVCPMISFRQGAHS